MKNYPEGIELLPYQQALLDKLNQGGIIQGQISLYTAGRQTGKSVWNNLCAEIMDTENDWDSIIREYSLQWLPDGKPEPKSPYKFSRAKWYVADFDWVHHGEVLEWCKQQFGPHPNNPDAWSRWYNKYSEKIHFRDSKDYEWFLLRWS